MKLLVLAQTPPPLHGQSLMVQTLLEGLPPRGVAVQHVDLRVSHDTAEIGRWRPGKIGRVLGACLRAIRVRLRDSCDTLYYVPAPGKRGALYRDWAVLLLCRPFFRHLVLHWHATGLTGWLETHATAPERALTRLLLGRADLSLVLADELRGDATWLRSRRIKIVPNGINDPAPSAARASTPTLRSCTVLFLGLGCREKGLFDTLEAVLLANQRAPGSFRLLAAGSFTSHEDERAFRARADAAGDTVRHVGHADDARKRALFAEADVFCFPTYYPHEGQPLVLLEALAHNVPIVTTRWRAIPGMLPKELVWYVAPGRPAEVAEALWAARTAERGSGSLRAHYLAHFTRDRHLATLQDALATLGS
jgi:glycosyltransferase involved in cell wall biosynthesis